MGVLNRWIENHLALGNMAIAADNDKMIGVWERVSSKNLETGETSSHSGDYIIITKKYFMLFMGGIDRAKVDKPAEEMTKGELLGSNRFAARFGSYAVSGNKVRTKRIRAKNPVTEGNEGEWQEFRFEGDYMIVTGPNAETRYKRIE